MDQTPIILLHGALGAASQMEELTAKLEDEFEVHTFNFEGHGDRPLPEGPFRIENFAANLKAFIDEHQLDGAKIFGFSMGGYVALYLAAQQPDLISSIFTLGTKFDWNPESAAREAKMLDPEKIEVKVPHFAETLAQRHTEGWKEICRKTAEMMHALGAKDPLQSVDLSNINLPVSIGRGAEDNMVTEAESTKMALALGYGNFVKFPQTPHPIEKVDKDVLAKALREFFQQDSVW